MVLKHSTNKGKERGRDKQGPPPPELTTAHSSSRACGFQQPIPLSYPMPNAGLA